MEYMYFHSRRHSPGDPSVSEAESVTIINTELAVEADYEGRFAPTIAIDVRGNGEEFVPPESTALTMVTPIFAESYQRCYRMAETELRKACRRSFECYYRKSYECIDLFEAFSTDDGPRLTMCIDIRYFDESAHFALSAVKGFPGRSKARKDGRVVAPDTFRHLFEAIIAYSSEPERLNADLTNIIAMSSAAARGEKLSRPVAEMPMSKPVAAEEPVAYGDPSIAETIERRINLLLTRLTECEDDRDTRLRLRGEIDGLRTALEIVRRQ